MEDLESIIMELLVNAGSARSQALTALQLARKGDFAAARAGDGRVARVRKARA